MGSLVRVQHRTPNVKYQLRIQSWYLFFIHVCFRQQYWIDAIPWRRLLTTTKDWPYVNPYDKILERNITLILEQKSVKTRLTHIRANVRELMKNYKWHLIHKLTTCWVRVSDIKSGYINLNCGREHMQKQHLPIFGVGPIYGAIIIILTAVEFYCKWNIFGFKITVLLIGIIIIVCGMITFVRAQIDLADNIQKNNFVTTGVYANVRNPLCSALMLICTGALFCANNLWFLFLPIIYWILWQCFWRIRKKSGLEICMPRIYRLL